VCVCVCPLSVVVRLFLWNSNALREHFSRVQIPVLTHVESSAALRQQERSVCSTGIKSVRLCVLVCLRFDAFVSLRRTLYRLLRASSR
jgi:hypothetical protein